MIDVIHESYQAYFMQKKKRFLSYFTTLSFKNFLKKLLCRVIFSVDIRNISNLFNEFIIKQILLRKTLEVFRNCKIFFL